MFRRLESTLPPDFEFGKNLKELGYFINENDQIRMIDHPDRPFHYWISKNERYVQRHREAFHQCLRDELWARLVGCGLGPTRLPLGTPENKPHVPVWVSSNLLVCPRVILYIGESHQDLGVFAGRIITNEGINKGSAGSLALATLYGAPGQRPESQRPGLVIANPGQLLWHRRGKKAITWESWYAIKRSSAVGPGYAVTEKNKIPGNETPADHVASVFRDIALPLSRRGCEVFVIAVGDTAHDVFDFMQANWAECAGKVQGMTILASNYVWQNQFHDAEFMKWFGERARAYLVSDEPVNTPLQGRSRFGCNVYSAGEPHFVECLMRSAQPTILDYFKLISQMPNYENTPQDLDADLDEPHPEKFATWGAAGEASSDFAKESPPSEVAGHIQPAGEDETPAESTTREPEEAAKDSSPAADGRHVEPVGDAPPSPVLSAHEPEEALTESIAHLQLSPSVEPSLEQPHRPERGPTITTVFNQHVPELPRPGSHSPEQSPMSDSYYSCVGSQMMSSGFMTPPEQMKVSVHETIPELEDPIAESIREIVEASTEASTPQLTAQDGLRVVDPNVRRARSISATSGGSTSSPPPPPAVPNSTPEMGMTPEPEARVGLSGNGMLSDVSGLVHSTLSGMGIGFRHAGLLREVLRLGDSRLGGDGLYEAEHAGHDEGEHESAERAGQDHGLQNGNGEANGKTDG